MFETAGKLDIFTLELVFQKMMPKWYPAAACVPVLLLFALAARATLRGQVLYAGVYLVFAMFLAVIARNKTRQEAKRSLQRMQKISRQEEPAYQTVFEEDGIYTRLLETEIQAKIPYAAIVRAVETERLIVLITEQRESVFVFRTALEDYNAFRRFLREKIGKALLE